MELQGIQGFRLQGNFRDAASRTNLQILVNFGIQIQRKRTSQIPENPQAPLRPRCSDARTQYCSNRKPLIDDINPKPLIHDINPKSRIDDINPKPLIDDISPKPSLTPR